MSVQGHGMVPMAFFIWVAENLGTILGAWHYPNQALGWSLVRLQLMSSWFLLVIVSVIIIAIMKQIKDCCYLESKQELND